MRLVAFSTTSCFLLVFTIDGNMFSQDFPCHVETGNKTDVILKLVNRDCSVSWIFCLQEWVKGRDLFCY